MEPSQDKTIIVSWLGSDAAYFYQSADGQRIFISGFNNRCLLNDFESLECAPHGIRARILASESFFMSEDARRQRFKYLAHLPLHSEFKIVELDLSDVLSPRTLDAFRPEFDERRRVRERKLAREKRECDRLAAAQAAIAHIEPHYYVRSAMTEISSREMAAEYLSEFPEASSSPPVSSGASLLSDNISSTVCNNTFYLYIYFIYCN